MLGDFLISSDRFVGEASVTAGRTQLRGGPAATDRSSLFHLVYPKQTLTLNSACRPICIINADNESQSNLLVAKPMSCEMCQLL